MNSSRSGPQAAPCHAGRKCLLVVEDELLIRFMLSDGLRDAGYHVIEACDGDEALVILETAIPDLIISDVRMPGTVDGLGLLNRVRELFPSLPVIITSGHFQPPLALAHGASQFIAKPYAMDDVVLAVQTELAKEGAMTAQPTSEQEPSATLIVDADIVSRHVIADYLRNCGYAVVEAANTDEAYVALCEPKLSIDVILCDVSALGSRSGFELATWVRTYKPELEVRLAAGAEVAAQTAAELCEIGPHLKRPYQPEAVTDYIKQLRASRLAGS